MSIARLKNCSAGCGTIKDLESSKIILDLRAIMFDFDGVFTDNTEIIGGPDGVVFKTRSHSCGQAVSLLREIGIKIMIATNASGAGAVSVKSLVDRWNSLPSVLAGNWATVHLATADNAAIDKVAEAEKWLDDNGIGKWECGVMGDDLVDIPLFDVIPFKAAPCSAEEVIRNRANFISLRPGGRGAVRDLANFILKVRGIDPTTLPCY